MTDLIPAASGWYIRSLDVIDPVIAWAPTVDSDGEAILLPYVPDGPGYPPQALDLKSFPQHAWEVVYLPNYDPAADAEPQA